eukprot:4395108-Amphidinium_carterae.1
MGTSVCLGPREVRGAVTAVRPVSVGARSGGTFRRGYAGSGFRVGGVAAPTPARLEPRTLEEEPREPMDPVEEPRVGTFLAMEQPRGATIEPG